MQCAAVLCIIIKWHMALWSSGQDVALSRLNPGFDSRQGHHVAADCAAIKKRLSSLFFFAPSLLLLPKKLRFPGTPFLTPFRSLFFVNNYSGNRTRRARASVKESGGLLNSEWSEGDRKGRRRRSLRSRRLILILSEI